ncbi:prolyl oligopeptidase family serine peptidase [Riemerella anatipestifer]|nr:prolyl oligopeptidase family serine peptidase [Riemerella anatipestifer]
MKFKILFIFLFLTNSIFAQKAKIDFLSNQPYDKYELASENDSLTFYLSVTSHKEDLPLIVYIQGSGMSSLFAEQNNKITPTLGHMTWFNVGQEKYRILIVEKPGIKYLQTGQSKSFDQNFSLENWSNRIVNAINYVTEHEKINKQKILVVGHSEGGVVASRVANLMKDKISNVAILAGNGATQLYSLYKLADNGTFFNTKEHNMPTSEQRLSYLKEQWKNILFEPNNTEKKFWGFTYLRWSSFLKTSVMEELSDYNGRILLLQGTSDKAVYPETATIAYTTLLTKGQNVELEFIENADHSFNILDKPQIDGWKMVIEKTINWFNE